MNRKLTYPGTILRRYVIKRGADRATRIPQNYLPSLHFWHTERGLFDLMSARTRLTRKRQDLRNKLMRRRVR